MLAMRHFPHWPYPSNISGKISACQHTREAKATNWARLLWESDPGDILSAKGLSEATRRNRGTMEKLAMASQEHYFFFLKIEGQPFPSLFLRADFPLRTNAVPGLSVAAMSSWPTDEKFEEV